MYLCMYIVIVYVHMYMQHKLLFSFSFLNYYYHEERMCVFIVIKKDVRIHTYLCPFYTKQ